jgi:hypothetical protein
MSFYGMRFQLIEKRCERDLKRRLFGIFATKMLDQYTCFVAEDEANEKSVPRSRAQNAL